MRQEGQKMQNPDFDAGGQGLLIDAAEDAALLLPAEERRKRFTGGQCEKLERVLACVIGMLAWGMPRDRITTLARISPHTLQTLAWRHADQIGTNALALADYAQQMSARCAYQAMQQLEKATGKDAAIMHGIFRDTAINLRAAGATPDMTGVLDVETVNPAVEEARQWLESRQRKPQIRDAEEIKA